MRMKLLIGVLLLSVLAMGALNTKTPASNQEEFYLARTVTASDTAWTTATMVWTTAGASDAFVPIPAGWTWVSVSAYAYGDGDGAGDPSSGTFDYRLLGIRNGCSAQILATGTMTVGGLQLSSLPYGAHTALSGASSYRWVEGPPTCTDYWPTGVEPSGTTDDIGSVNFATNGLFGFTVEVTALANCTHVYIVYTGGL